MAQLDEEEVEEEDVGKSEGGGEERKQQAEDEVKDSTGENPLEKYMKMVLEARGEQQEKVTHPPACMIKISAQVKRRNLTFTLTLTFTLLCLQHPVREETHWSPEARTLSEEKDNR